MIDYRPHHKMCFVKVKVATLKLEINMSPVLVPGRYSSSCAQPCLHCRNTLMQTCDVNDVASRPTLSMLASLRRIKLSAVGCKKLAICGGFAQNGMGRLL